VTIQDTFNDRHLWRQTRNGNFMRTMGPFKVFIFRQPSNRWGWSIRSDDAMPEDSVFEAKQAAFAALEAAIDALVEPVKSTGRFKTVDPFCPAGVDLADWLGESTK
jgi:hypothetical protein